MIVCNTMYDKSVTRYITRALFIDYLRMQSLHLGYQRNYGITPNDDEIYGILVSNNRHVSFRCRFKLDILHHLQACLFVICNKVA